MDEEEKKQHEEKVQEKKIERLMNPILFARGVPSDEFYLILQGKVTVCSGNEGFLIDMTTFNFLGAEALQNEYFVPDFSAKVIKEARLLKITREEFRRAISGLLEI
jgi:CRP-like cAMP-binding protein